MANIKTLLEVSTSHPHGVHTTGDWRRKAYGTILCPECHSIKRECYPNAIDVVLEFHPEHRVFGLIWSTGVSIFHVDFIEQIREHLVGFVLGKCLSSKGDLIPEYVTCYNKDWIVQRGNEQSRYRICKTCGAISPSGWFGPQYTLRAYLTDAQVYMDRFSCMYIDEELALQLDFSPWPDADLRPIEVRERPADGQRLPIDPPEISGV